MSQQPLDLRKSISIVRRLKGIVGIAAALGLLAGVGYATLNPPALTSVAIVSFPASVQSTATEVVIAGSDPVLSNAAEKVSPPESVGELRSRVQVKSLTTYLISITASGKTAREAESAANAVAASYIAYVADRKNPVGHVVAQLFQPAATATPPARLKAMLITGLVGLVAGALVGAVVSLAIGKKDRRLRERDEIAKSIGIPVLASVTVGHPSDPAGWRKLLENYKPKAVHAWQLRTALQYVGLIERTFAQPAYSENGHAAPNGDGNGVSLAVVSLSSDPAALALGPQLAVFAASQGIPTALVIGPQQDENAAATLRTACAAPPASAKLPYLLQFVVSGDQAADQEKPAALTVAVIIVDGREPEMPVAVRTTATLIGVSSGGATAEQLARAAVAAAADDREVTGILVADPEPTDQTIGRVPPLLHPPRRRLPNRLNGIVTESRR